MSYRAIGNDLWAPSNQYNTVLCPFITMNAIADKLVQGDAPGIIFGVEFTDFCSSVVMFPTTKPYLYAKPNILNGEQDQDLRFGKVTWGASDYVTVRDASRNLLYMGKYIWRTSDYYANYEPYTKVQIYLPFLGWIDMPIKYIINRYIYFWLKLDYKTGVGTYYITWSNTDFGNIPVVVDSDEHLERAQYWDNIFSKLRVIDQYTCNVGTIIPLTATNINDMIRNYIIGGSKIVLGALAKSPAIAASGVTDIVTTETYQTAPTTDTTTTRTINPSTGRLRTTNQQISLTGESQTTITTSTHKERHTKPTTMGVINDTLSSSLNVFASTQFSSNGDKHTTPSTSSCGYTEIVIRFERMKIKPINEEYERLQGLPCGEYDKIYKYGGFTKISNIRLTNIYNITDIEFEILTKALLSGVVFDDVLREVNLTIDRDGMQYAEYDIEVPYRKAKFNDVDEPGILSENNGYIYYNGDIPIYLNPECTIRATLSNYVYDSEYKVVYIN